MARDDTPGVFFHDSSAGGETGRLIRNKDWTTTPLGARASWPRSLGNYVGMIHELPTAAIVFWGPEQVQIYNDGYAVIMGPRHPRYLGATFRECWPEAYETIHPWMERVLRNGETVDVNRTLVPLMRHGFTEEAYFTFSFTPLRDDDGCIAGILQLVTEVTAAVLGERRAGALHDLSNQTTQAKTVEDATRLAAEVMGRYAADLPFSLIYVVHAADPDGLALAASSGVPEGNVSFPSRVPLGIDGTTPFPELALAVREHRAIPVENLSQRLAAPIPGPWPEAPIGALVSPILAADQTVIAIFVAGLSARLKLDGTYQRFLGLVTNQLAILLAAARAADDSHKRVEALAAIDRAKTEFFSNVSHEFRTPLTLMLGPTEDALASADGALKGEALQMVHRNALRLMRLVNALLDFSRVESGRVTAAYEPCDLSGLTTYLAGAFCSAVERAGLRFEVDCEPLPEPVYVDRDMWERIVLNLLSNALKFTFEGGIRISIRSRNAHVDLEVTDSGTGIAETELPRLFERFHRIEGARSRSHEGSGIGLALVHNLVRLHGGTVDVASKLGNGTTFTVHIPRGLAHLPPERVVGAKDAPYSSRGAVGFIDETLRWSAGSGRSTSGVSAATPPEASGPKDGRILVADDNVDLRDYIRNLLDGAFVVETVNDGIEALAAARRLRPDLILSDVMMPRLDGFGLLQAVRADPTLRDVPFILLSARAGEESTVEGLESGADDYLAKPFSARELRARIRTHLDLARTHEVVKEARDFAETANRELESFSYSVAHDLRAPLRSIDGFSQALLEDYADKVDDTGKKYLSFVRNSAQRMAELIDDLLALSRVTRAELVREPVDLTALARTAIRHLQRADPDRKVEIVIEPDLLAEGDPRLLAIAFDNLLGNAWKFTRQRADPCITVGVKTEGGRPAYFIRDNGAGFDMAYANKLFGVFQRLHADTEFEGTGIGLATVRRIVNRHHGRIWAEGKIGEGATFRFTLYDRNVRT